MSNFTFGHNVFKSCLLILRQNASAGGKGGKYRRFLTLLVIGYPFNYGYFLCFNKICSKSSAAELLYEGKG